MNLGLTKWLVGALAYTAIAVALVPAFSDHWDYPELTLSALAPISSPSAVANLATDNPAVDSPTANAGPTAEAAGASTDPTITQEEPAVTPRRSASRGSSAARYFPAEDLTTEDGEPARFAEATGGEKAEVDDLRPQVPALTLSDRERENVARMSGSLGAVETPAQPTPSPVALATAQPTATAVPVPTSTPTATPAAAGANKGEELAALAARFDGAKYLFGGHSPNTGFDCSGFTWYVYDQAGVKVPLHDLAGQLKAGPRVERADLLPGDLVFFQNTYKPGLSHAGIYVGNGRFVHAVDEKAGVRHDNLDDRYWQSHYLGASRPW